MQAGQTIAGKYTLNRLLGTGGMASVWSAINVFTEREFAMKFMLPQVARTPEAARRFLLEAKVSARINHPNIIEVIDVGQAEDGSLFLVMELLTGVSLDVAVRRRKPPMRAREFLKHMRDVAQALAAAHRSGVVHRDLKPTNIFLHEDREGRVVAKILDFGVSKILEEENTGLTMVGTILGSPLYMSPEQAMGSEGIDGRTDVFAFGAMLFEALSGVRAYDAANFNALIVTIATTQPRSIDEVAPHLPQPLRALIRDCLVTDKSKRIQVFDEIVERLDAMLPDIEASSLRLPAHPGVDVPSDAAATKALLAVGSEPSEPPPSAVTTAADGGGYAAPVDGPEDTLQLAERRLPASAFARRWSNRAGVLLRSAREVTQRAPRRNVALVAGSGGLVAVVAFGLILWAAVTPDAAGSRAAAHPALPPAPAIDQATVVPTKDPTPAARPADSAEVPVISVDSLPVATRQAAQAHGNGRLSIATTSGRCSVSVDGVPRGSTPVALEIGAGVHRVDCTTANGRPKTASVTIVEGGSERYTFALNE